MYWSQNMPEDLCAHIFYTRYIKCYKLTGPAIDGQKVTIWFFGVLSVKVENQLGCCCYFDLDLDCVQHKKPFHISHICTFTGWTPLLWHLLRKLWGFMAFPLVYLQLSDLKMFPQISHLNVPSPQQGQYSLWMILFFPLQEGFLASGISSKSGLAWLLLLGLAWAGAPKAKPLSLASREKEKIYKFNPSRRRSKVGQRLAEVQTRRNHSYLLQSFLCSSESEIFWRDQTIKRSSSKVWVIDAASPAVETIWGGGSSSLFE